MLAPLHQIQKEDVSQASATVMPPSISQEETQNEDYDPQRPDAIMDHDFACVTSNGFSKLPSVEEFNQELDKGTPSFMYTSQKFSKHVDRSSSGKDSN